MNKRQHGSWLELVWFGREYECGFSVQIFICFVFAYRREAKNVANENKLLIMERLLVNSEFAINAKI